MLPPPLLCCKMLDHVGQQCRSPHCCSLVYTCNKTALFYVMHDLVLHKNYMQNNKSGPYAEYFKNTFGVNTDISYTKKEEELSIQLLKLQLIFTN